MTEPGVLPFVFFIGVMVALSVANYQHGVTELVASFGIIMSLALLYIGWIKE